MKVSSDAFRRACACYPTGVTVTTCRSALDGSPQGLTVNSFTSVSMEPPTVLVCINRSAGVYPHFKDVTHFAVNILAASQGTLCEAFSRKKHERFEGVAWHAGEGGAPVLEGALAVLECEVIRREDAGGHTVLFGEVHKAHSHAGEPLVYFRGAARTLAP
jgi:flavin reductase (DIM6/NTAB) family NADH-FMN oxidoreductase RutF